MPKKTKGIKKTDLMAAKPWLRKVKISEYRVESREINKLVLITCEGQTEKLYFESFPVLTLTVQAIDLKGESKLKLIESTEQIAASGDYDSVWCVFDMDYKMGEKEFADFDNAIIKGKSLGYEVAYSNDSFELWFYLHYQYSEQKNIRTFYYDFLSKQWNLNYERDGKKYNFCLTTFNLLDEDAKSSQSEAISRAKKLHELSKGLPHHERNPITLIYRLVEFLNQNKRP